MQEFNARALLKRMLSHPTLGGAAKERSYDKGERVFTQGEVCREIYCMRSGLVKLHFDTFDGKEWIKSFIADQGIFGSRRSQSLGEPSPFSAACLERSEIVSFPYELLESACLQDAALGLEVFHFTQWLGLKKERREYQLLCIPAEEAYLDFVASNPRLVGRLTQVDIARYLGITPIALSRIKKRLGSVAE